ncbi:MAG: NAD(P)-binding domain-containing protein [Thermoleophilia bacterium]
MNIGVLGTGMVGRAIGSKLVSLGHSVTMGSRTAANDRASEWAAAGGERAAHGTFADAAAFGEVVFNCTAGLHSLEALRAAGAAHLEGKVLIDVANALDGSRGMPPRMGVPDDDSLGEQIQRAFPAARVVKTLNTVNCEVMVEPGKVPGLHTIFLSGDDAAAKSDVRALLREFGWPDEAVLDLGDITTARGPEMYLPLWLRLWGALGTGHLNIAVMR